MTGTPSDLPIFHRTAHVFVDESGTAQQSPILAMGALKFRHGHGLVTNAIETFRNQADWRAEAHFVNATRVRAHLYREIVDILARSDATFRCIVLDTRDRDPFASDRAAWKVHAQLAISLLVDATAPGEIISATLDHISVPIEVNYESYVRTAVNRQLGRMGAATVCRMDSRTCAGLQLADIMTGAVAHQYRQSVGDDSAKAGSPKGQVAAHVAKRFNLETLCNAQTPRFFVTELKPTGGRRRKPARLKIVGTETA